METVVFVLMIIICFNFVLKQSFNNKWSVAITAIAAAIFVGSMWGFAIEQSKTQIASWLHNSELMLDISVVLSIEIILSISYCLLSAYMATTGSVKPRTLILYRILRCFPGLLIFPVLFSMLVYVIFAFPGYSFPLISWSLAVVVLIAIPLLRYGVEWLLPEKELRLELLYLTNFLVAALGVITTVNGRTTVVGTAAVDWLALAGVCALVLIGGIFGIAVRRIRLRMENKITNQ